MTHDKWNVVLDLVPRTDHRKEISFRIAGDDSLFVEYGREAVVDYMDMFRVQAANQELMRRQIQGWTSLEGFQQALPQWRAIQYTFDPRRMSMQQMLAVAKDIEAAIGDDRDLARLEFRSPVIELPLCWEHPKIREAIDKYVAGVKPGGCVCIDSERGSNLPYVALCNGVSEDEIKDKVFGTEYLNYTMCFLVGLNMQVALDRRCRLLTNKYNPPRTWTARSTYGLGGFDTGWYSSVGAGGYQILGLLGPMLQMAQKHPSFRQDVALCHTLDRIKFVEVSESEIDRITALIDAGSSDYVYKVTPGSFSVSEWLDFEREHEDEITGWIDHSRDAFAKAPIP